MNSPSNPIPARRRPGAARLCAVAAMVTVCAAGAGDSGEAPDGRAVALPAGAAVLDLVLPVGAEATLNGTPYGPTGRTEVRPCPPGAALEYDLRVKYAGGGETRRPVWLQPGWVVRLPLPAPDTPRPGVVVQAGHTAGVAAVALSRDGDRALTGSADGTAILWDLGSGLQGLTLRGHTAAVTSVAFSPDGRRALTASEDRTARLWDADTGAALRTFRGHTEVAFSAAFSPDGRRVLTASGDRTARLWDAETGRSLRTFPGHTEAVFSAAFSPDGKRVLTGSGDRTARLWDAETGATLQTFRGHNDWVRSVAFSPDGRRAVTGSGDDTAVVWDLESGLGLVTLRGHAGSVVSAAFSPDGARVLTVSGDRTAALWDVSTRRRLRAFKEKDRATTSAVFSADGRRVFTGCDRTATLWEAETAAAVQTLRCHSGPVLAVAFAPDGGRVLTGSWDGTAALWDAAAGQRLRTFPGHKGPVHAVAFSPDGRRVLTGSADRTAALWETATGRRVAEYQGDHSGPVLAVAFAPDGGRVLTGSWDGTVTLWDAAAGQRLRTFPGHKGPVQSVAFSPDGGRVLTGSLDHTATVWDAATGRQLLTFKEQGHRGGVESVAFSPDGRRVLTAGGGVGAAGPGKRYGGAILWDAATGGPVRPFPADSDRVTSVAPCPDGRRAVAGSGSGSVVLWDLDSGRELLALRGHDAGVTAVAVSPDGRHAVSGSRDGTARLWDLATGDELALLISLDAGEDWLVVTPQGLFDGSPGGRRKVAYRVAGGTGVVPVDRFFQDFYRPGLLAEVRAGERPMPAADFGRSRPPQLRIVSPGPGVASTAEVTLRVEAVDRGGGIAGLSLYQNGVRVQAPGESSRDGAIFRRAFTASLTEGTNLFQVTATSDDGSWDAEPARLALTYETPSTVRLHLVAVGVSRYDDPGLRLAFAAGDAEEFTRVFQRLGRGLYESVNPTQLFDEKATRAAIRKALRDVASQTRPADTLVVVLAGHGTMVGQRYYFIPFEFRRRAARLEDDVREQGVPVDELSDDLSHAKALKRVLILDTCASGGALDLAMRGRSGFAFRGAIERLARTQGVFTIAAAGPNSEAQESNELGHGVLTYSLLAGLGAVQGGPLKDVCLRPVGQETTINIMEWFAFAASHVPRLTEALFGAAQEPETHARGDNFPILRLAVSPENLQPTGAPR